MIKIDEDLGLRLPEESDISDLLEVKNDKESATLLGRTHGVYTEDDMKNWIEFHNGREDEVLFVVVDLNTNHVIGHAGLYKIDKTSLKTEYGILIGNKKYRGKGVGTRVTSKMCDYAFKELGLRKIKALVLNENQTSLNMFLKCGFVEEGYLRCETFKNGHFYDVYSLAKLEDMYSNR